MDAKKRFFVYQSEADKKTERRSWYGSYTPTCSVLDRETVHDGKYAVVGEYMKYLDAYRLASHLNETVGPRKFLVVGDHRDIGPYGRSVPIDKGAFAIEVDYQTVAAIKNSVGRWPEVELGEGLEATKIVGVYELK